MRTGFDHESLEFSDLGMDLTRPGMTGPSGHDWPVLAWLGLSWLGLSWIGLTWLGLTWLGLTWPRARA